MSLESWLAIQRYGTKNCCWGQSKGQMERATQTDPSLNGLPRHIHPSWSLSPPPLIHLEILQPRNLPFTSFIFLIPPLELTLSPGSWSHSTTAPFPRLLDPG